MPNVAIVTDTISCLPPDLIRKYNIGIVPIGLLLGQKVHKDTELSNEKFWELFNNTRKPVKTTPPDSAEFQSIFTELAKQTDSICCILVSKALSTTCDAAAKAREALKRNLPSLKIEVVDSKTAAGAEGFIVLEAARAAHAGNSLSEVVAVARSMVPRVKFVTAMGTLNYVIRSGRAPRSAVIGSWFQVKPILGIVNGSGQLESLGRGRGINKIIQKMVDLVQNYVDPEKPLHIMAHYTDDKVVGEKISQILVARYRCSEIYVTPFSPVMTSQTGPLVAISFYS